MSTNSDQYSMFAAVIIAVVFICYLRFDRRKYCISNWAFRFVISSVVVRLLYFNAQLWGLCTELYLPLPILLSIASVLEYCADFIMALSYFEQYLNKIEVIIQSIVLVFMIAFNIIIYIHYPKTNKCNRHNFLDNFEKSTEWIVLFTIGIPTFVNTFHRAFMAFKANHYEYIIVHTFNFAIFTSLLLGCVWWNQHEGWHLGRYFIDIVSILLCIENAQTQHRDSIPLAVHYGGKNVSTDTSDDSDTDPMFCGDCDHIDTDDQDMHSEPAETEDISPCQMYQAICKSSLWQHSDVLHDVSQEIVGYIPGNDQI